VPIGCGVALLGDAPPAGAAGAHSEPFHVSTLAAAGVAALTSDKSPSAALWT